MEQLEFFDKMEETNPICPICGNGFEKTYKNQNKIYCSPKCARKGYKNSIKEPEHLKFISCVICNNVFKKTSTHGKYCSKRCKRTGANIIQREAHNKNKEYKNQKCREWRLKNLEYSKQKHREWVKNNKEHIKKYRQTPHAKELEKIRNKKWSDKNKEVKSSLCKKWRENKKKENPNYDKERYWNRRDSQLLQKKERYKKDKTIILKRSKEWRENNKEHLKKYKQKNKRRDVDRQIERYKTEPNFRLRMLLRRRIADCIMRRKMSRIYPSMELLGTDIDTAREHIEKQFKEGMTWDNHGHYGWHIDHIIPCSSFDLTDPEQQKKCFHYTNLQPLRWRENISKGNKII